MLRSFFAPSATTYPACLAADRAAGRALFYAGGRTKFFRAGAGATRRRMTGARATTARKGVFMSRLPEFQRVADIQADGEPAFEAWLYHFLTENNLEYLLNPSIVSSPEQLRFMVALHDEQVYLPCDDDLFFRIYSRKDPKALSREYLKSWRFIVKLVNAYNMGKTDKRRIIGLCRYRFRLFYTNRMILPSRMIKRLVGIVLTQCGDPDPFRERKRRANAMAAKLMRDFVFQGVLNACPSFGEGACLTIPEMRRRLDLLEMSRIMALSTHEPLWQDEDAFADLEREARAFDVVYPCLATAFNRESGEFKKILFIPDVSGGFMLDLLLIRSLVRQGHQVVLALKDAFYFNTPTIWDAEGDQCLKTALEDALHITNAHVTKNELLQLMRENRLVIISDGTTEQLNMYRVSVTFARAWKECDLVIAKGRRNRGVLLGSSHQFTRDIVAYWRDEENGSFHAEFKPRARWVHKFAEKDILGQAKAIVREMRTAREEGKTIMFYSAIIGSIPGQTKVAVSLVNAFVAHLRDKLDNTFIINPAEHFEEGMDGDDLMYMWEHVQRSGFLDVWRFQTVEDIEASFSLIGRKVPAMWSGKDSTFSTGCTKEMRIALDMQRKHPELQIIGPSPEKFFRRRDYGVGTYFDATLKG